MDRDEDFKVQDASGNTTQFKIKTATALKKLMSTYCERNGLDVQVTIWLTWKYQERASNNRAFIYKLMCHTSSIIAAPEYPVHI